MKVINGKFALIIPLALLFYVKSGNPEVPESVPASLLSGGEPVAIPEITKTHRPRHSPDTVVENIVFYSPKEPGSTEKIVRKGILTKRANAKGTILICHGYMCDKFDVSFLRTFFPDYNCMVFDFRAHGEKSPDECCTLGENESLDVISAAKYLKSREDLNAQKFFGYGFSMGAASLIEAQAKEPILDGLILDCPFDSSENIINKGLNSLKLKLLGYEFDMPGKSLLQKYAFSPYIQPILQTLLKAISRMDSTRTNTRVCKVEPVNSIKKISAPCFFIHCKNDDKVPVQASIEIYKNAPGYKRIWLTAGRRHFDSVFYNPEQYKVLTNKFLSEIVTGKINKGPIEHVLDEEDDSRVANEILAQYSPK